MARATVSSNPRFSKEAPEQARAKKKNFNVKQTTCSPLHWKQRTMVARNQQQQAAADCNETIAHESRHKSAYECEPRALHFSFILPRHQLRVNDRRRTRRKTPRPKRPFHSLLKTFCAKSFSYTPRCFGSASVCCCSKCCRSVVSSSEHIASYHNQVECTV